MSFPTFDQSLPWTKKTNRTLENELSNTRSVVALNQENESNSWKWAYQHSISRCPEPRKRIELLKMSFPTFDQSLPWTKKTNRTLENELSNTRSVVALNQGNELNSWKWAFQHSISRCPEPIKRIELLKMSFPTLDQSLLWTKKTNRTLENELTNTRSVVALNQENESNSWKWAYQHSISPCPEPRKRIELLKMSLPTLDQSLPWTKKTNRTLENELSNIRSVVALNQENESNSWKWAFQHSISRCPEPRKRIELLKMSFPTLDQSLPWTKKTNRTLENELSNTRSVVALNQGNESNSWKWAFQHSISRCPEPRKRIELLKMSFPTFDQSLPWTKKTNRTLENELSNIRSVVALNQENESNSWKWTYQHSISRCPEPRKRIELLKMSFPTLDQSLPWTKKTNRTLENELSNTRSVVALNQENESNSWKWAYQHSISRCPEPRKRIELLKMSFPTLDQSLPWTKKTNRTLENELSNTRSVVALNQENESNSWKWAFQHSISRCPEPRKRIELLKMSLPTLDQSLPWTKETNRTLENELSNTRSVVALNQENESNSWKWAYQHSISRCLEPRKRIELLKMSFPILDQSLPWTKKTNRTLENELSNIRSVVALNQENESNSWKWAFQHSISRCPEPRKRIELFKMNFPTLDQSLPWTKKTNRTLENELTNTRSVVALNQENESNSWNWVFQHSISRCPEPRKRIELLKMSFPTLDQSLPWTKKTNRTLENELSNTRSVVALNQENESNSWKWAFQHSISRCPEPRKRIELLKMSFPTLDQSLPWTKKTNRTLENELSNIGSVVALNQENESNSWKWAFQHSISRCPEPRNESNSWKWAFQHLISRCPEPRKRIELLKMSFPTLDQSLPWTKKTNRTLENELTNIRSVVALNQENESNSWKWAFQYSISRCPEPRKRIELLKMSFPTLDQSLPWTKKTNRTLENELSNTRSVVALNQENESNSWKWAYQHSISRCPEPRKRIELLKMSFPTLDQSLLWTKKTNRTLENELTNTRSVVALNQENESNSWKWAFQYSISRCPEPRKRIELLKMSFPTLDQSLPWTKKTNRTLENELSNTRSVVALNQENESNSWKWAFQHSISRCPEPRKRIELLKMSFPTLDQSLPWTKKTNRTLENELSNTRLVVALNQENESNSWKWAFQHSISRCPEPRKRIELLKMSLPTLDQSLLWTKKTNRTLENELTNIRSVVALNQENESNSWKWAFQHSISRCPEPRKRIELLKMSFPTLDQSLLWTKKTNRTLENELTNTRSVVALNQENESNSWKWAYQYSISRCPEPRKRIELLKMSLPTLDQSLPWTKKTNRTLENELSNTRSVVALNQENESNYWKWAFQHSISRCPEPRKRIELLKMSFPTFD